jgi:hypothetical protein
MVAMLAQRSGHSQPETNRFQTLPLAFMDEANVSSNLRHALYELDRYDELGQVYAGMGYLLATDPDTVNDADRPYRRLRTAPDSLRQMNARRWSA